MNTLKFDVDQDGIALIALDLPDRAVNVFTPELVADLENAIEQVLEDSAIKGAVLTSAKSVFLAGADLKALVSAYDQGLDAATAAKRFERENSLFRRMETGGKPFVAAINGLALGGGLEICLACHHRVLADSPKAKVGLPEVSVGLLPAGGGTQRLPRLIGIEKALPLLLDGTQLKPAQALELGVVDALAEPEQLIAQAKAWLLANPSAQQPWDVKGFQVPGGAGPLAPHAPRSFRDGTAILKSKTQGNYPAPLAILSAVYEGTQTSLDVGLRVESKYFGTLLADPVARNLMRTLFINKAAADKLEHRPQGVAASTVRKLGVLGAGMMGAGIAHVAAAAGIEVILIDASQDNADKGKAYSARILGKSLERGQTSQEQVDALLARIQPSTDYALLDGCDLVVEAVFESRAVKAEVIAKAEAMLPSSATFCSNTSTLPITGLAAYSQRPEQFIGMHFFSPVERMPLVEIIVGAQTSQATIAKALDLVGQLKKTPIVVNDSPGFYTSRIFCSFIDEGMAMLAEGVKPALIENAARLGGMATGPLAVTDEVALDLQLKVALQAEEDGLDDKFRRLHALPVIRRFNELGRLGRKTGGGFYEFPQGGKKHLWPGLAELYPQAAEQPDVEEVRNRLLYIQALESARCVEEGVIDRASDADLGSILGIGFPSWTGGALSFIDSVGLSAFVAECERLAQLHGPRFAPSAWLYERAARNQTFYAKA
ncbi:3-hydroxyacyl-CoA dehydrogenase NAD-binding domain-containing protein [Pseudomonas lopnurensis]|uniref:3-hydroxyacyl-CoA dehydrogenase NAD-binding domain-containing protein n=1 Tax=Pseudomonas lopnurensis TaxID=1477517 RepID=UPI0028B030E6|nr:3-hydroxyacyl-CoA dehydrogenase NAD-binding domain-containing protein [Pseudomonas lopnurensis]